MAVKDYQYQYFPSQERLVNISNYMINPHQTSSSPNGRLERNAFIQNGGYNVSDSFRNGRDRAFAGDVEANPDFEMKNVQWSEETSAVSDLIRLRFPVIVKVVKGYYGNDGQHLNDGQILQVYMSCEELRVTATDSRDRTLTLPINCPLDVRLHSGPHSASEETQKLSDLLKDVSFPARVEVIGVKQKDKTSSHHLPSNLSDSLLMLKEISLQKFLVANAISNGWLDQSRFLIIPEQLKLTFRLATGVRHVTKEEWKDICGMYSRAARHLKFHLISGYNDVIYDDWINQSKPPNNHRPSSGIDSDADEDEADDDSDSDSAAKRTRVRLLRQQAPLSQGSLPSLPTALRDCAMGSDPRNESRMSVGSLTPSHLSTESVQISKSTESLLPRGSIDSEAVVKETVSKRKSNMPPRLLRRKADTRKQDSVLATEFELKSDLTKTSVAPRTSELVSRSTSRSTDAPATDRESVSRSSANDGNAFPLDNTREFVFGEPSWKDKLDSSTESTNNRLVSHSPAGRQGQRSPGNPNNVSSDYVSCASFNDDKKIWPKNDGSSNLHGSSDDTPLDFQSVDGHVWSPVYWSSDLCIGASASGSGSQISRMKRTKAQKRSAILSRDLCAYPNATVDRPQSTPMNSSSTIHSLGFLDSTQSLFSSTSTELSAKHRDLQGVDRVHHGHRCLSTEGQGLSKAGTYNDTASFRQPFHDINHMADPSTDLWTPNGSTGYIATRQDYNNPIKLGVNRSRKLSNGLVRMKLDQNGTVLSSGSEVIDDGYSTKGNSMTSSVDTLHAKIALNTGRESLC